MSLDKRLFRYLNLDMLKALGAFWAIIITVNILFTGASYHINPEFIFTTVKINNEVVFLDNAIPGTISFVGSNIFALMIFFIVYGIVVYHENFSLAGIFGVTRKKFYLHTILSNIIIVGISSTMQIILLKIDNMIMTNIGYNPMTEFWLFNMNDSIILNILLLGFVMLVLMSLGNLLGAFIYRFGVRFWIGFGLFVFVMTLFASPIGILLRGLVELMEAIAKGYFLVGIIFIILAYGMGFILIRKADVK